MCGIAGISGNEPRAIADILGSVIKHRGPDDSGSFKSNDKKTQLFHQRLSIIDLSDAASQPMLSSDGSLVICYNGEIYNYKEIRKRLEKKRYDFKSQSDTEVVLLAYHAWGESFLKELNGIFALAIYDIRSEELLIARDPLGVKPLYYADQGNRFGFCSELKGLIKLLPEIRRIDHDALRNYFSYLYCPGNKTPFQAVKKVEPGAAMLIKKGQLVKCWNFYDPPFLQSHDFFMTPEDAAQEVHRLLSSAVERQMVSDVPIGAFLSGGVDSTGIVSLARNHGDLFKCFTIKTNGGRDIGETDDLPFAKQAAVHLDLDLEVIEVDAQNFASDFEKMIWHLDEPIADPASLNTLYISQMAQKSGIKVLLSGTGGDDLFSGYRRHHALQISQYFNRLPLKLRRSLVILLNLLPTPAGLARKKEKFAEILSQSEKLGIPSFFLWGLQNEVDQVFKSKNSNAINEEMLNFLSRGAEDITDLQKMLALEQRFFLGDHNLNYADKMGMAASVEIRVPFLDHDLVNFAASIPDNLRVRGRSSKWILKQALKNDLPKNLLNRPKTGFGVPIRNWFSGDLHVFLCDILSNYQIKKRGLFDPVAVTKLIEDSKSNKSRATFNLLSLLSIEVWCQKFLDAD